MSSTKTVTMNENMFRILCQGMIDNFGTDRSFDFNACNVSKGIVTAEVPARLDKALWSTLRELSTRHDLGAEFAKIARAYVAQK